ncbi:MAG: proteasome subunit beta [Candidatus Kariarchaeaceae archaeon]
MPNEVSNGFDTTQYKHGTTNVALRFKDGVVAAADQRASMGFLVASPTVRKIHALDDRTVATIAGLPSDAMYLIKVMRAEIGLYELNRGRKMSTKAISNLFSTVLHNQFRTGFPFFVGMLIAGRDETGGHVFNYDGSGSITDDPYTATGSGMPYALGVLEALWAEDMDEATAIKTAAMAVRSAILKDLGSGDGLNLFVINKEGLRELSKEEIKEVLGDKYPIAN